MSVVRIRPRDLRGPFASALSLVGPLAAMTEILGCDSTRELEEVLWCLLRGDRFLGGWRGRKGGTSDKFYAHHISWNRALISKYPIVMISSFQLKPLGNSGLSAILGRVNVNILDFSG